jgi:hypothetical protein
MRGELHILPAPHAYWNLVQENRRSQQSAQRGDTLSSSSGGQGILAFQHANRAEIGIV